MALGEKLSGNASASAVKAGEAFFEVNADDSNVMSTLKRLANRINSFGGLLKSTGLGIAGVGTAVLAPVVGLFASAVSDAASVKLLADRLGETTEGISRASYAAKIAGINIEELTDGFKTLNEAMFSALDGDGKKLLAFQNIAAPKIGEIQAPEIPNVMGGAANAARDFVNIPIDEKLITIANGFEQIENPLEKSQYLISLFGENARKFLPLISKGAKGIRDMYAEAEANGAIVTSEQGKQAKEISEAWSKTFDSIKRLLFEVGAAFFGFNGDIKDTSKGILTVLADARNWVKENRRLIVTIAGIAAGVIALGGTLFVVGTVISGLVSGFLALKAVGAAVLTVVFAPIIIKLAVLTGLIAGAVYAFTEFTDAGKEVKQVFGDAFEDIGRTFKTMFTGILDALKSGNLKQAGEIGLLGLEIAWKQFQLAIMKSQKQTGLSFQKTWADVMDGTALIFEDAATGIAAIWIYTIGSLQAAWAGFTDAIGATTGAVDALAGEIEGKLRGLAADNEANRDAILKKNLDREKERDKVNEAEKARLEKEIEDLKKRLGGLAADAANGVPKPGDPDKARMDKEIAKAGLAGRLGDAVKGTFRSADYRGSLALGPANDYAKKNNEELKNIRKELEKLNAKPGPMFN